METVHVLRVEATFPTAGLITREIPFGGRYNDVSLREFTDHRDYTAAGPGETRTRQRAVASGFAWRFAPERFRLDSMTRWSSRVSSGLLTMSSALKTCIASERYRDAV